MKPIRKSPQKKQLRSLLKRLDFSSLICDVAAFSSRMRDMLRHLCVIVVVAIVIVLFYALTNLVHIWWEVVLG